MTEPQETSPHASQILPTLRASLLACLVALLTLPPAFAQATPRFSHQAWTTKDGLPQNSFREAGDVVAGHLRLSVSQPLPRAASSPHDRNSRAASVVVAKILPGLATIAPLLATFLVDITGDLWIGTRHGLFLVTTPGAAPIRIAFLGDQSILSLSRDQAGDLSVGTICPLFQLRYTASRSRMFATPSSAEAANLADPAPRIARAKLSSISV